MEISSSSTSSKSESSVNKLGKKQKKSKVKSTNAKSSKEPFSKPKDSQLTILSSTDSTESKSANSVHEEFTEVRLDIDDMIRRLLDNENEPDRAKLKQLEVQALAFIVREKLASENLCIEVQAPIRVVGDIHGQYRDLIRIFRLAGFIPEHRYIFLGDYVDRGSKGLEVVCLLFAYKMKYPNHIYLLRGNHETEVISRTYGFRDECVERFGTAAVWRTFLRTFNFLPMAAIIEKSVFCCHGGISPEFMAKNFLSLTDVLNRIPRPFEIPNKGLLCDLLWSDPIDKADRHQATGFVISERGCSYNFGWDKVEEFLEKFDLDLIVRAHQVVEDGYEFYANRKCLTVFSAPNYCGEFDNAGGVFCLGFKDNSKTIVDGSFLILKPDIKDKKKYLKSLKKNMFKKKDITRFIAK